MAKATPKSAPKVAAKAGKAKNAALNGTSETDGFHRNQPILNQRGPIIQEAGTVRDLRLGLEASARREIVDQLNILLANTITIASLYKKHHWQVSGHTFYQLHLLFDKHYEEQDALIDTIAERISILGGVATGMPAAVAKISTIENPPEGIEEVPAQLSRLLEAHEVIMKHCHELAKLADDKGDDGTNDLAVSDVLRLNEFQVWFLSAHLVDAPLVIAD